MVRWCVARGARQEWPKCRKETSSSKRVVRRKNKMKKPVTSVMMDRTGLSSCHSRRETGARDHKLWQSVHPSLGDPQRWKRWDCREYQKLHLLSVSVGSSKQRSRRIGCPCMDRPNGPPVPGSRGLYLTARIVSLAILIGGAAG